MRLQVFSDLHADVRPPRRIEVAPGVDAVVVAGDTCEGAERGFALLRRLVPMPMQIIAVMGNHEYYRSCLPDELGEARRVAPLYGVRLLEDSVVVLGGVRIRRLHDVDRLRDFLRGEHRPRHARGLRRAQRPSADRLGQKAGVAPLPSRRGLDAAQALAQLP